MLNWRKSGISQIPHGMAEKWRKCGMVGMSAPLLVIEVMG